MKRSMRGRNVCFNFDDGRLSFTTSEADQPVGWVNLSFEVNGLSTTGGRWTAGEAPEARTGEKTWCLRRPVDDTPLVQQLDISVTDRDGSMVVRHTLVAEGGPFTLHGLRDGKLLEDASLSLPCGHQELRLAHTEHVRTEKYPAARPEYPWVRRPPITPTTYGHGEANQVPALILTDSTYGWAMVEASMHEVPFRRLAQVQMDPWMGARDFTTWTGEAELGPQGYLLEAGHSVTVGRVFYQLLSGVHVQDAMDGYIDRFASMHDTCGPHSTMLHGACYCTWNYGPWDDVHERELLERARIIRDRLPDVTMFLLDDGYQRRPRRGNGPLSHFYPDPEKNVDTSRFGRGMKKYADSIRQIGLMPGIWLSTQVLLDSDLAREQPGWLLQSVDGRVFNLGGNRGYLDISVPGARRFVERVLVTLFETWGFEGLKMDFQSHQWEMDSVRYRRGTPMQWKHWFYRRIRELLGPRGLFETCIAMSMGNPMLSLHCDAYRLGADISEGQWHEHIKASSWAFPPLLIEGGKTALANLDSFGWSRHASRRENLSRMAFCFVTGGMLEFGGCLEAFDDDIMDLYRRVLEAPDRGHGCRVLDEQSFTGEPFPRVIMTDYPEGSRSARRGIAGHVGLFNWGEHEEVIGVTLDRLGVEPSQSMVDFWTDRPYEASPQGIVEVVPPHGSRLLTIMR